MIAQYPTHEDLILARKRLHWLIREYELDLDTVFATATLQSKVIPYYSLRQLLNVGVGFALSKVGDAARAIEPLAIQSGWDGVYPEPLPEPKRLCA